MILFLLPPKLNVLLAGILLPDLSHTSFTQVVSFGGSLSDADNLFQTAGSSLLPHFICQFSDGQGWYELLAINPVSLCHLVRQIKNSE